MIDGPDSPLSFLSMSGKRFLAWKSHHHSGLLVTNTNNPFPNSMLADCRDRLLDGPYSISRQGVVNWASRSHFHRGTGRPTVVASCRRTREYHRNYRVAEKFAISILVHGASAVHLILPQAADALSRIVPGNAVCTHEEKVQPTMACAVIVIVVHIA